jgi:hypothetical protein
MKYLPAVIIDIIKEYVPNIVYMFLNRENYVKYHHLFLKYISNKNMEQYIRQTVRQDHAFVFNLILVENFVWWLKMKKYLYRDCIYANYLLFLKSYALEYDSLECNNLISRLLTNLGLSKNQHKKNIVRNIRWKN